MLFSAQYDIAMLRLNIQCPDFFQCTTDPLQCILPCTTDMIHCSARNCVPMSLSNIALHMSVYHALGTYYHAPYDAASACNITIHRHSAPKKKLAVQRFPCLPCFKEILLVWTLRNGLEQAAWTLMNGLEQGVEWVPALEYLPTLSPVIHCGNDPRFIDQ